MRAKAKAVRNFQTAFLFIQTLISVKTLSQQFIGNALQKFDALGFGFS